MKKQLKEMEERVKELAQQHMRHMQAINAQRQMSNGNSRSNSGSQPRQESVRQISKAFMEFPDQERLYFSASESLRVIDDAWSAGKYLSNSLRIPFTLVCADHSLYG